jgi:hypothetical protein
VGVPVTDELYDLVLFVVHSFVRPIATELYALKHHDITVADDPKRLIVTVRNGKTGFRSSNTMPGAVSDGNLMPICCGLLGPRSETERGRAEYFVSDLSPAAADYTGAGARRAK